MTVHDQPHRYSFTIDVRWSILATDNMSLGSPDISIISEVGNSEVESYYFSSRHLNTLDDPQEVWARALSLKALYVGAYNLICNADEGGNSWVGSGNLSYLFDTVDGYPNPVRVNNIADIIPIKPFDDLVLIQPILIGTGIESNPIAKLIYYARTKQDIYDLLLQLGQRLDYINLYSILDTLSFYTKGKKNGNKYKDMLKTADVKEREDINRFTNVANNYGLLGVIARHGRKSNPLPEKPITLSESKRLIIKLSKAYIKNEYNVDTGAMAENNFLSPDELTFDF